MEKLSSILNNIKERFTNPLVFSFICSWCILNWQIVLALLWHDDHQIEKTGCNSIFEFVEDKLNPCKSFWLPLSFAVLYTLLMPVIKNLIKVLYTRINKWGENWNLEISEGSKISIEKFLKLRSNYEERTKTLEEVINKESSYLDKYNDMDKELLETKKILNETNLKLNETYKRLRDSSEVSILDGFWKNEYSYPGKRVESEQVFIQSGLYYIINPSTGERMHAFNIKDFYYDTGKGLVFFVKEVPDELKPTRNKIEHYNNNRLFFNDNKTILAGTENGTTGIRYIKKID